MNTTARTAASAPASTEEALGLLEASLSSASEAEIRDLLADLRSAATTCRMEGDRRRAALARQAAAVAREALDLRRSAQEREAMEGLMREAAIGPFRH